MHGLRGFRNAFAILAILAGAAPASAGLVAQGTGAFDIPELSQPRAADMKAFRVIARREAERADLPYDLVDAVMRVESNYNASAIGGVGEIGLMQVLPTTAEMMGFRGLPDDLADPATNIRYGATYLGKAWHLTKGNVCRTLMKYRAGHGEETMSPLSVAYCTRAKAHLASIGSPLADAITPADLVASIASPERALSSSLFEIRGGVRRPKTGEAFWSVFKARIRKANARIEAKWARTAAR